MAARPDGKVANPNIAFGDWVALRRDDRQLTDNLLRTHERVGGKVLGLSLRSQEITGSLDEWEQWMRQRIVKSGTYTLPGLMQPATIDVQQGRVSYFEPIVWIEHRLDNVSPHRWTPVDKARCQTYLATRLPAYMVPQQFTVIAKMPMLPNGKIDRGATELLGIYEGADKVPPQGPLEQSICKLWCEVLGIGPDSANAEESFFVIGGHSLKAVSLLEQINAVFGVKVPLVKFYKQPTIRSLSTIVSEARATH
jgi:acyl carrier protein